MALHDSTVLVGSMFYEGDDVVLESDNGKIDEQKVRDRIDRTQKLSKKYNVPFVIDIEIPSLDLAPRIIGCSPSEHFGPFFRFPKRQCKLAK